MSETKGEVVQKLVLAARGRGKAITEEQAREAIAREYNDYIVEAFNPSSPSPDIPRQTIDSLADDLMDS